jgi:hypothetical protein
VGNVDRGAASLQQVDTAELSRVKSNTYIWQPVHSLHVCPSQGTYSGCALLTLRPRVALRSAIIYRDSMTAWWLPTRACHEKQNRLVPRPLSHEKHSFAPHCLTLTLSHSRLKWELIPIRKGFFGLKVTTGSISHVACVRVAYEHGGGGGWWWLVLLCRACTVDICVSRPRRMDACSRRHRTP